MSDSELADVDERRERLAAAFAALPGVSVVASSRAEHCGAVYVSFRATEEGLKEALRRPSGKSFYPPWFTVTLDGDGLLYATHVTAGREWHTATLLEGGDPDPEAGV